MLAQSTAETAWCAGLFEGEGSWFPLREGGVNARLKMTDADVVERFASIVGFGSVIPEKSYAGNVKSFTRWASYNAEDISEMIVLFWPWLGARRRARALDVLQAADDRGVHASLQLDLATTPVDPIPWAAALFEAEGWFYTHPYGNSAIVKMCCESTDRDVLERFRRIVGGEAWSERPSRGSQRKPTWAWGTGEAAKLREIIGLLLPWFGERRRTRALEVDHIAESILTARTLPRVRRSHCLRCGHLLVPRYPDRPDGPLICLPCRTEWVLEYRRTGKTGRRPLDP